MIPPSADQSNAVAPHGCVSCQKLFPTRTALEEHVNSPDHPYKCDLCKTHHAEIAAFRDHLELSHSGYMCTFGSCPYWSSEKLEVEQHFRAHQEVAEHASGAVRARKIGNPEGLEIGKRKTVAQEQGADGVSVAPGVKRRARVSAVTATAPSGSPVVCPFRMRPDGNGGSVCCRTLFDDISPLIKHLQSVHGLEVTDSSLSSFSSRRFTSARVKSGVCQACWKIFRTAEELSAHLAHPCTPRSLSKFGKQNVLYHAFANIEAGVEELSVAVPAVNETEALPTTRTLSSSPYTPLKLPRREETTSGDFSYFDKTQVWRHVGQYYQENHSNTGHPKANGSDLTDETSTSWQGVFGSVQASNESAGGTPMPSRDGVGVGEEEDSDQEGRAQSHKKPKPFACPYFKHDPEKYRNQRTCCGPGYTTVHRIKEHLWRKHLMPRYLCGDCNEAFETNSQFVEHCRTVRDCSKQKRRPPDGIDEAKQKQLRARRKGSITECEKWKSMYRILFPDDVVPKTSYYEDEEAKFSSKYQAAPEDTSHVANVVKSDYLPKVRRAIATTDSSNKSAVSPANGLFAERLQAANNKHLNVVPAVSPSSRTMSQYNSAFRYGSPLAPPPINESSQTILPLDSLTGSPLAPSPKHKPSSTVPPLGHLTGTTTQTFAAAQPALRPSPQTDSSEPNLDTSFAPGAFLEAGVKARHDHQPGQSMDGQQDLLQLGSSTPLNYGLEDEFRRASDISLTDDTQLRDFFVDDTGPDPFIPVDAGDTQDAPLSLKAWRFEANSAVPPAAIDAHPAPYHAAYRFNSDLISETDAGSDSGYGHPPTRAQEGTILGDFQSRHPPLGVYPVPAQTDSGYASLPHGEAKQLQQASKHGADPVFRQMPVTEGEEVNDVETMYSDDRSQASVSKTQRYISEFVDHLFGKIKEQMEEGNVDSLRDCLPDLLQAFALKVGQSSASRDHYEVMYFVHKHRRAIAQSLQDRVKQEEAYGSSEVSDSSTSPTGMSIDDKLSLWLRMESTAESERQFEAEDFPEIEPLEDELDLNELYEYQSLIMDSPAFDWLVGSLKRELHLANSATVGMIDIRKRILQGLPTPRRVSRKQAVPSVQVVFRVSWDPLSFIEAQGYDRDTDDILSKTITLTGSSVDAQAATCKQYLCQTWPSTGEHMLRIMEDTVGENTDAETPKRRTYILPDNTRITATHANQALTLNASGTAYSMVEIGEQLGWLITALQSSPHESKISVFYPTVTWFPRDALSKEPLSCYIGVTFAGYVGDHHGMFAPVTVTQRNGDCWPRLFRNPVVVGGYPIPRRQDLENGSGLEIPLDMLVALTDATGVSEFDGKIFIKGYSAMLIPTKQVDGLILWHLLFNEDGGRIPYTDCRIAALDHINPTGIKQARHILGWVSHARNNTGSPNANYDIKWSGLGKPRERHAWEKVIISGGDSVGVSASFVIGKKDKGILAGGLGGYASRLKFISKQYVVLYDLDDRRAWLVDGLSALLHMVRASLEHDQKDVLNPFYLYSRGQMKESAPTLHGPDAAAAVLFNPQNCSLRLYTESEDTWDEETETRANASQGAAPVREVVSRRRVTYYCLKDRVLEIFSLLEKMIDHLNNVQAENGVGFRLRGTPRNILEGFDFMDVATSNAPIRPHMIKLNICESGRGWTDLLRSIQAITLFGKGFGELISPAVPELSTPTCGGCGYATSMPAGKDYLATCVSLVERILTTRGSTETVPWCLSDDIYWHTPGALFDPCCCASSKKGPKPDSRVQVLLPSTFPKLWGRGFASPQRLETMGAVMFSHNWRFPFRLGNDSNQKTKMLEPHDSGLGTSVDSSSTRTHLSGSTDDMETQASNAGDGSSVLSVGPHTAAESVVGTVDFPMRTDTGASKKRKLVDVVDRLKRKVMKPSSDVELETFANEHAVGGGA